MAIEIVDLPINSMVIFHSYVKLPEGTIGPMFTLFTYVSVEVPYCKGCNHLRSPRLHKTLQRVF